VRKQRKLKPFNTPYALRTIERILEIIEQDGRVTSATVQRELHVSERTARKYLVELRARERVFIIDWTTSETDDRRTTKVWGFSEEKKDKRRPPPTPRAVLSKRSRKRVRDDPERYMAYLTVKRRANARVGSQTVKRDPLTAAFFGATPCPTPKS
jgi:predicted ArsR family transcriptional regulator